MRLSGWNLPIERISASSLATAITCPEMWRRKYLLKQKERMSGDRFVGIVDHETWEAFFKAKMEPLDEDWPLDSTLEASYRRAWENLLEKDGEVSWGKLEPEVAYKRGLGMIAAYLPYAEKIEPVAVEEWIELSIPNVPVPLVGKIDVRTTTAIIDRKTTPTRLSKPKSKWRFQARIYQLAHPLPFEWSLVTKQVTCQVVTPAEAPELVMPVANADVTVAMIQHTVARLSDYYERHGPTEPWPMDGLLGEYTCGYCSFGSERGTGECLAWS